MYPGQGDQFGAPFDPNGGDSIPGGVGGPPGADAMFESFFEGEGDESGSVAEAAREERGCDVLTVGLHFFEKMRGLQ